MSDVNFVLVYHENSDAACEATTRFFRLKENAQKAMLDDFCAKEGVADCPAAYYKDDDNFLDVGENSIIKQDGIDNYSWTIFDACPEDPADAPEDPDSTGKRIFNLVIMDSGMDRMSGEDVWVLSFLTDIQDKTQAKDAAYAAVVDFLKTPEAKEIVAQNRGFFNWGDAMVSVPAEFFIAHRLTPVRNTSLDAWVDHDECLPPDED